MIRARTTMVIGPEAGAELELPGASELLQRIEQGFAFQHLGTGLQTPDQLALARHLEALGAGQQASAADLLRTAAILRGAARIARSAQAMLDQLAHEPLAFAALKLALVHFTLQAEARSPILAEPRDPGDLPLRGEENWLFQLARLLFDGQSGVEAERCLEPLTVIALGHDRALEHYLPHAAALAFGLALGDARQIVARKLRLIAPFGRAGRLPWQGGEGAAIAWGQAQPGHIARLAAGLRSPGEALAHGPTRTALAAALGQAQRLVLLGCPFDAACQALLLAHRLPADCEVLVVPGKAALASLPAVERLLGQHDPTMAGRLLIVPLRAFEALRDYAPLLES